MSFFDFGGGQQRQVFIHENEKADGDDDVYRRDPAADLEFLFRRFAGFVLLKLIQLNVGRKFEGAEAEGHGVTESHNSANHGPSHPFMLF